MGIEAPTGNEQPRKHYGSPYLHEIEEAQERIKNANATGTEADLSDIHNTALAAVMPQTGEVLRGQSYEEANNDPNETLEMVKEEERNEAANVARSDEDYASKLMTGEAIGEGKTKTEPAKPEFNDEAGAGTKESDEDKAKAEKVEAERVEAEKKAEAEKAKQSEANKSNTPAEQKPSENKSNS